MRSVLKTAILASALVAAMPAAAQVGSPGPVWHDQSAIPAPGGMRRMPPPTMSSGPQHWNAPARRVSSNPPHWNVPRNGGHRWGGNINGRWHGGMRAPGGWGAYRRPSRGYQLDRYWMANDFMIPDYASFGLRTPPNGYFWLRYYDDAVMVDSYGRVRDSVSGIAWAEASAEAGAGYASASSAASAGAGYDGRHGGAIDTVDPDGPYYEDDQRYAYPEPQGGYAPPAVTGPPAVQMQRYSSCPNQCPPQVYAYGDRSYSSGGYYGGATTTTVVIQYAPVVTTTTTEEIIEESSGSYERTYVSRPRTKLVRRGAGYRPTKRLRRSGCGC